jgi:hypothetical protein
MRIGLVGRGPQADRYLDPRNSGSLITSQVPGRVKADDYIDWLQTVDAVVIATHPAGHLDLGRIAISVGKPVLIEKPLALTWEGCAELLDAAEREGVPLEVAHTNLWHERFPRLKYATHATASVHYSHHERDYSPWLDWGPHLLAMLEETGAPITAWSFSKGERRDMRLDVMDASSNQKSYTGREAFERTAMWHMLQAFARGTTHDYDFQRRVYRALFDQEAKNGE